MEQYYDQFITSLHRRTILVANIKTAIYFHDLQSTRTVLMIHGGGGDFHGMIPLSYHLKDDRNIILLDLPCHGRSELLVGDLWQQLQLWSRSLIHTLEEAFGITIDTIVSHSFGCYIAQHIDCQKIWYINPPLQPTNTMKLAATVAYWLQPLIATVHLNHSLATVRGIWMLYAKTPENKSLITWLTHRTNVNKRQLAAYIALTRMITTSHKLQLRKTGFLGIIIASHDTVVHPVQATNLQCNIALTLDTGHLSVIEKPSAIASAITMS